MKIMHIITRFNSGGTATWLNELVRGDSFSTDILTLVVGNCSPNEKEGVPEKNFEVITLSDLRRAPNLYRDLKAFFRLTAIIRHHHPDIVNTHTFKAGVIGRLACAIPGNRSVRVVHTFHGHLKYGYFNPVISRLIIFLEQKLEGVTDGFIVAGHQIFQELRESKLLRKSLYKVILPGLESQNFRELRNKSYGNKVGWIGRLTQIKRPDRVLEVARILPELEFYIGGSGELEAQLRKDLPRNVHLAGWVDPKVFWQEMSAGLLTSDNEATPYAIIEGNMAGVPFVATRVGSVVDVVDDGENGYLAETNSVDLAKKLNKLMEDKSRLQRLSESAQTLSHKKFSLERFQREHRDFYIEVMRGRHFH